jgi:hypothetical protein
MSAAASARLAGAAEAEAAKSCSIDDPTCESCQ